MTRPKVDPEKRQRTANACDSCKRRKQKCDGSQPCTTCSKKHFTCTYNTTEHRDGGRPFSESQTNKRVRSNEEFLNESSPATNLLSSHALGLSPWNTGTDKAFPNGTAGAKNSSQRQHDTKPQLRVLLQHESTSDGDEEVDNHTMTRMLEDGTGRLIYVGDSATLSFLQLLRMIVENVAGPSPFSLDPGRHAITETQLSLLPNVQLTHQLPSRETSLVLIEAFFVHTHGLMQVFDEKKFLATLDNVYSDPLTIDHKYLCHLNLVLAIGCCLATPEPDTQEAAIVDDVRSKYHDQSEVFYLNAKSSNSPFVGLEDGDTWSVQALLLMAAYTLFKSKRNTAYSLIGMAVRTAYSLGMHREETLVIFPSEEQESRKKLWRSLFIMDRLLATYLGRPVAIDEQECSGDSLNPRVNTFKQCNELRPNQVCSAGLEATARSAHVIGLILQKVYLQRRISTKLARELADECKQWPENLSPALHWRRASSNNRRQAVAILNSNLAYCHSIILLSRPFFLYLLSLDVQRTQTGTGGRSQRSRGRMEKFSDACVIASLHTIALVQNAYEGRYLPKLNSAVTYSLFAAALIIFANEFARPSSNPLSGQCMANAISIMAFCGEMDPQAQRAAHVLAEFRNVIIQRESQTALQLQSTVPQAPFPATALAMSQRKSYIPPLDQGFTSVPPSTDAGPFLTVEPTTTSADAYSPSTSIPLILPREDFFSGFLDLNNTVLPSLSDPESSGPDEAIDFDALWGGWPDSTQLPSYGVSGGEPEQVVNGVTRGDGPAGTSFFDQV